MLFQTKSPFEKEVLAHLPSAYNLARWLVRSDSDAEDVVQDACLRAYQHFSELRGSNAKAWLLTIVRNSAFSALRKFKASSESISIDLLHADSLIDNAPGAYDRAVQSMSIQEMHAAIDRLPAEFKEMIVLRDLEELSYAEIAGVTQMPIGTVMSRLSRARKRLRESLSGSITEDGGVRP